MTRIRPEREEEARIVDALRGAAANDAEAS